MNTAFQKILSTKNSSRLGIILDQLQKCFCGVGQRCFFQISAANASLRKRWIKRYFLNQAVLKLSVGKLLNYARDSEVDGSKANQQVVYRNLNLRL